MIELADTLPQGALATAFNTLREYRVFGEPCASAAQHARTAVHSSPIVNSPLESDGALAGRAVRGDDDAFAVLMARHKGWAYQFVRRYVGNSADAYDVLQETFFAAWRALSRYEADRPFEFWLRRIALNKCRDRNRRETVRRVFGAHTEEAPDVSDPSPGPAARAEQDQEMRQMEIHLDRLPRALKEALLLTALEGLSQEEAGRLLGVSAKSVETKVYRARIRLAELYGRKR